MADPERMCSACRERAPKRELLRVVRTPDGNVIADTAEKIPGRGAYLCRRPQCFARVRKTRALDRMLKVKVPDEVYDALEAAIGRAE